MNFNVHPVVALLVIVLAISAIGVWMWGSGEARRLGGPAELLVDPNGHLYVQMQNQLLEHDADGEFVRRHDLAALAVETVLGGTAFFSNGDILIRRGADPRSLTDNIRAFFRHTNRTSTDASLPDTGLYRCNLRSASCQLFGAAAIDFKATYGVFIDPATDEVYFSDTTRHVLHKYSSDGWELAGPVGGFKFPNQLMMYDGQLFVADTNRQRIRIVDPATSVFANEIESINVVPPRARQAGQTWPSHLARVDDQWWVNNMRSAMNEGGIYIFDNAWIYQRRVNLPTGSDPIAVLPFNNEVLVSDWNNDRVHRVAISGDYLGDLESAGLDSLVEESNAARLRFQLYGYLGVAAFLVVIGLLLLKALTTVPEREHRSRRDNGDGSA